MREGSPSRGRRGVRARRRGRSGAGLAERPQLRRTGLSDGANAGEPAYAVLNTAVWQGDTAPPFDPQPLAPLPGQRWAGARPPNPVAGAPPTDTIASWPPPASTPGGTRRLAQRGCGGRWRHGREQWTRRHGHGPERSRQAGRPLHVTGTNSHAARTHTPQRSAGALRDSARRSRLSRVTPSDCCYWISHRWASQAAPTVTQSLWSTVTMASNP